jgi:predicted RNA-binding protein with PUA domain
MYSHILVLSHRIPDDADDDDEIIVTDKVIVATLARPESQMSPHTITINLKF